MHWRGWLVLLALHVAGSIQWLDMDNKTLSQDHFTKAYPWRGPKRSTFADTNGLMHEYVTEMACPAIFARDNCFSHNPERANKLLRRRWKGSKSPVNAESTLQALRNKRILLLGDSTMSSTFASLVCYFAAITRTTYSNRWLLPGDVIVNDSMNQTRCPRDPDCYLLVGQAAYPKYNLSIDYEQVNTFNGRARVRVSDLMASDKLRSPTIAVINFGVHYHNYRDLVRDLGGFVDDWKQWMQHHKPHSRTMRSQAPTVYWMESFPQHFSGGYFNDTMDRQGFVPVTAPRQRGGLWCTPLVNEQEYAQNEDWRNALAHKVLPQFAASRRIVRIAQPLYSQWDAHVDYGDSRRVHSTHKDCTHYCLGSGVFRFVVQELLHTVAATHRSVVASTHRR